MSSSSKKKTPPQPSEKLSMEKGLVLIAIYSEEEEAD